MRLKGLKTIVTGGGGERGIGRAIVRAFGKEGADVCVVGRSKEAGMAAAEDVRKCGGQAMTLQCNISEYDEIKQVVDTVLSEWGQIDVLVNNAGMSSIRRFVDLTPEEVEQVWKVNFFGTFFMQQLVCKHMIARAEKANYKPGDPVIGKIINHSSISEKVGASHLTHYAPTKA
ncbi:MAG: SDR family NAD(P)-dependent oxidoreductase, partial [Planctomycetes bacterium]|nr:SDR family NAD(P)-dependent oxidoreductase [Planctomycetota bacterium]